MKVFVAVVVVVRGNFMYRDRLFTNYNNNNTSATNRLYTNLLATKSKASIEIAPILAL